MQEWRSSIEQQSQFNTFDQAQSSFGQTTPRRIPILSPPPPPSFFLPKMSSVQPHREFHESIENNRPPAHSTRSKTPRPGTASRMAAAAPKGSSKGQARRGQSRTATAPPDLSDSSLSDIEESSDEAVQEPARKRRRTTATPAPTPARAAEAEMVQRAKDLRARAELIEAENALRKAEMNSLALREQGDTSASQGTYSDRVMSIATQLCVQPQLVSDIAGNRFIAVDIARLCSYVGPARWEETVTIIEICHTCVVFCEELISLDHYPS